MASVSSSAFERAATLAMNQLLIAAQRGGQGVVVPRGEARHCRPSPGFVASERPLYHVAVIVEDKDNWLQSIASHGPNGGGGQLVRSLTGEKHGPSRRIGQGDSQCCPCSPSRSSPTKIALCVSCALGKWERKNPRTRAAAFEDNSIRIGFKKVSITGDTVPAAVIGSSELAARFLPCLRTRRPISEVLANRPGQRFKDITQSPNRVIGFRFADADMVDFDGHELLQAASWLE